MCVSMCALLVHVCLFEGVHGLCMRCDCLWGALPFTVVCGVRMRVCLRICVLLHAHICKFVGKCVCVCVFVLLHAHICKFVGDCAHVRVIACACV